MKNNKNFPTYKLSTAVVLLSLTSCGWVDSTGQQNTVAKATVDSPANDSVGNNPITENENTQTDSTPPLLDPSLVVLDEGDSFVINENAQKTIAFSSSDKQLTDWSWTLLEGEANIQSCERFDDFEAQNATNSLSDACAGNDSCEIKLEEQITGNGTQFYVTTPQMRAPAALEFLISASNNSGETIERRQLLCAIPINEAPEAIDDRLTVTTGTYVYVPGDGDQSLLANDSDDDDIRNEDLQVVTTAVNEPRFAAEFELFSDGGYVYEPLENAPLSSNGSISDRFTYAVTDGLNVSTATVSIKIIEFNSAPIQNIDLPEIQATITPRDNDIAIFYFRDYFSDAENNVLSFSELHDSFPESGNVYLTEEGVLKGNPLDSDSGRYFLTLAASDSIESVEAGFYLNVVRGTGENKAPYANDIDNKEVRNEFTYDVSGFFGDADQDHLSFTATGLPADVEISPHGVIYGESTANNRGTAFIRVTANDGNGGTSDDGFRLKIR